jgi:hypothetical protein
VKPDETSENPTEREIFETIKTTYTFALEPEQRAMIKELRSQLATIPVGERTVLINDIENAIGQNIEEQEFD